MSVAVVVGNPKARSRTYEAAMLVAERLTGAQPDVVVDVVDLGHGLLGWADPGVNAAVAKICAAELVVVASPTFKATYTGLLKLFLDQVPTDGMAGMVAVPMMLGAGPGHALAPELLLKPVLVELGASCPTPALYLLESDWSDEAVLGPWLERAQRTVSVPSKASRSGRQQ